ncbi:CvpA family protein [Heliobacterium chlorum]|uniref:CvpA family protein n=1 Tax=Heliobacterium chlorum TaxID=2698 RepID=A0ABR7T540_HELCL|nr:CvpA family protein [Heliobacterium chlorum]
MNALDGLILIIVGICFYRGYRRGLLAALLGAGAYIFSFFLATSMFKPLAVLLDQQLGAVARLQSFFFQKFMPALPAAQVKVDVMPSLNIERALKDLPLPDFYKHEMAQQLSNVTVTIPTGVNTMGDMVANYLANSLWNTLVFVVTFAVFGLLVKLVVAAWIKFRGDGWLGQTDRLLGATLAAGTGWAAVVLVLAWFYGGTLVGASPLRVETQPLLDSSRLMPVIFTCNEWMVQHFSGYTFR